MDLKEIKEIIKKFRGKSGSLTFDERDHQRKYMQASWKGDMYYPAELADLEKEQITYRQRKRTGSCNRCASPVEHQVYNPRKKMFFDFCLVCTMIEDF